MEKRADVQVRRAQLHDHRAVADLLQVLYAGKPALSAERFEEILRETNTRVYVAVCGGVVVGTVTAVRYDKLLYPVCTGEDLVVDERFRSRGIGALLGAKVVSFARRQGAPHLDLSSRHAKAKTFYTRYGFKEKADGYYAMRLVLQ